MNQKEHSEETQKEEGHVVPHIISLGAGVQSSTMALMAAAGEITPMPAFAVFADTGDEPQEVYDWLQWLTVRLPFLTKIAHKPFPSYIRMENRRLSANIIENDFSQIPCFTRSDTTGKATIGKRQCTRHWKIDPVKRKIREALGTTRQKMKPESVVLWQGISYDEATRMKESREPFMVHRFPLYELKMTRQHCYAWMASKGFPRPPKSACVYCPYKDRRRWQQTKDEGGEGWKTCVSVSRILEARGEYLTADLKPIDEIEFNAKKGNDDQNEFSFADECEGMCGV